MVNGQTYLEEIIEKLKTVNPYKIILFGSLAKTNAFQANDIDLLVVLNSRKISKTFEERLKNKLLVRNSIYELSKKIPIDLIVYTKAEYEIISRSKSSFIRQINRTGKIIKGD